MPGSVDFEYDEGLNLVFTVDKWEIREKEDVDGFFGEYERYFDTIGKKFYMISCIDGLLVQGPISDYYAERARFIAGKYLLGFARWGSDSWARMTVRATSKKAQLLANIFDTREDAVEAIKRMQA
ncbi:MAG: hypothetical protein GY906_03955 [bacterium]|nr:hypothetical protein [bacterium]